MEDSELIPAATVVLVRDGPDGIEVLMLKRSSKVAYGDMWVFPGGRVDPEDLVSMDERGSARQAAIREAAEETSLKVDPNEVVAWAYWVPPDNVRSYIKQARRRYSTWFFLARSPEGAVTVDMGEIHAHEWMKPLDAIARRDEGEIELAPPTWITLYQLAQKGSVGEALDHARQLEAIPEFRTFPVVEENISLLWSGDHEYPEAHPAPEGSLNRLIMDPEGWVYVTSQ